uniref:Uncharacterized protein n=1 Tax=Naja naja TaxID=35670 RepID=A0A8C6VDF3_NAJNA
MSSSSYPPNQGAFSGSRAIPAHSVQYTFRWRHQQEFAVPDFRTSHLEVGQGSQLLQQQQQLRRRPSLLSEFHPGSDRKPQERRSGYESQFHTGPSQADLTQLDSKRHAWTRFGLSLPAVSATAVLPLAHQLQEGLRSSDLKKVKARPWWGGDSRGHAGSPQLTTVIGTLAQQAVVKILLLAKVDWTHKEFVLVQMLSVYIKEKRHLSRVKRYNNNSHRVQ